MIVNRRTFNVKPGQMDEIMALVRAETERIGMPPITRAYRPYIGPFDLLAVEWEFESLAQCDEFWTEWFAAPEADAFMSKFNELIAGGGTNEIWQLEE